MADAEILPDWAARYIQDQLADHLHIVNVLPVDEGRASSYLLNTSQGAVMMRKARLGEVKHWFIPLPGEHVTFTCGRCDERMDLVDPDVPRAVYCSACGSRHFLVVQNGELNVIEDEGAGHVVDGHTLYKDERGGQVRYFFSKSQPRSGEAVVMPDGASVRRNGKTGVPELVLQGEAETVRPNQAFYSYKGDIHNVIDLEGIGEKYAERLIAAGVKTTARLMFEDAAALAARIDVPQKRIRTWQAMAELVIIKGVGPQYAEALARSGIESITELKKGDAKAIADQVNAYLSNLDSTVVGTKITAKRVAGWQKAASGMRKVRSKVPAE